MVNLLAYNFFFKFPLINDLVSNWSKGRVNSGGNGSIIFRLWDGITIVLSVMGNERQESVDNMRGDYWLTLLSRKYQGGPDKH